VAGAAHDFAVVLGRGTHLEAHISNDNFEALRWANDHGIWDLVQTVVLAGSAVVGLKLLFFPKSRVRHLNFSTRIREATSDFPLRLDLEIRNLTGRSIVISNAWFEFGKLRPDPNYLGDSPSGEFEVKFPGADPASLTEVEYLIRNKESLQTFIALDPTLGVAAAQAELARHRIGTINCTVTWLDERPRSHKLRRRL
jgi:hypothetical protein